jgi:predicted alpha/beta-hydrolase family hydrolase
MKPEVHRISVSERLGEVSALLLRPKGARALYVFAHGAGAPMTHHFMEAAAEALATRGVATFRYQFPYTEAGRRAPDRPPALLATVRQAVAAAAALAPDLPLLAGGKSMGGRMTALAQAEAPLPGVRGLAFYGFPLHAAKQPSRTRAAALPNIQVPMLFLQGTRDALADLNLMRDVCGELGARATLHIVEGADHGFALPKARGLDEAAVCELLADTVSTWSDTLAR